MARVVFFIDGFNVYHSLDSIKTLHIFKWINYTTLARQFIRKDTLQDVYLFTAFADWSPEKVARHKILIRAQENWGVKIVYGKFYRVEKYCTNCHTKYQTYEEKQTDVNIASYLLKLAIENVYDKAVIVSGDSDLIPAIKIVKDKFPSKNFHVVIPINRKAKELISTCDDHSKMTMKHLRISRLDNIFEISKDKFLQCPYKWFEYSAP